MDQLKNCPFCGKEPSKWFFIDKDLRRNGEFACMKIYCSDCSAAIRNSMPVNFNSEKNPGTVFMELEKKTVEIWNLREKQFSPGDVMTAMALHGQSDERFKLGETIRYSPSEVKHILENQ